MQYIDGIENYRGTARTAVTFGKFDGLHKGHQKLINKVQELGEIYQVKSIVCSFDMNRREVLMTREERQNRLQGQVDYLVRGVFTDPFRRMSAEDFIKIIVKNRFCADYVVVGADFHFGYRKTGDIKMLKYFADIYNYKPIIIYKECYGENSISSTHIKDNIRRGNMRLANILLGYNYSVTGNVKAGTQLRRTLSYPTFNIEWPEEKLLPPMGVYFTRTLLDGIWYNGISSLGVKPTLSENNELLLKTHLFGYRGNAYGKKVKVEFLELHRIEKKFRNIEELQTCVSQDIISAKRYFGIVE